MNKGLRAGAAAVALVVLLGGCASGVSMHSEVNPGPVGIGKKINELKGTPCACTEIPMSIPTSFEV